MSTEGHALFAPDHSYHGRNYSFKSNGPQGDNSSPVEALVGLAGWKFLGFCTTATAAAVRRTKHFIFKGLGLSVGQAACPPATIGYHERL